MTIILRQNLRVLATFVILIGAGAAVRAQSRIEDCEKIQAADAYNQCLAKFGPTSKVKNVTPAQPGDVKASGAEAAAGAMTKARGGRHAHRSRVSRGHRGGRHVAKSGGRKRMTISVTRHR